jgi:hypothetical protein
VHPDAGFQLFGLAVADPQTWQTTQAGPAEAMKYAEAYADDSVVMWENRAAMPRAFLVPSADHLTAPNEDELNELVLTRMAEGDFDPERVALVDTPLGGVRLPTLGAGEVVDTTIHTNPPLLTDAVSATGSVRVRAYEDQRVVLDVRATRPAVLVLTDSYYPGWTATVDGRPARVLRADFLFRAVVVPPGEHVVEFAYRPLSFDAGLALSRLSAQALAALAALVAALAALPPLFRGVRWLVARARHALP